MTDEELEVRSDIDKICLAVMADTEALEDAKMTLEVIMKTDPGVYDEMINDTLSLIRKALSSSILSIVDKLEQERKRLHEVNAELVEALGTVIRGVPNTWDGVQKAKVVLDKAKESNHG